MQRSHLHDRIHGDRRPHGVPPVRPAGQANHGGVGDQARQVRIERRGVARARTGHDDRVVQPAGGGPGEQVIGHRGHGGGQDAGGHRLAQPPELAPDEQLDGHGHGQDEQGEQRHRGDHDHQRMRQPVARAHDIGLRVRTWWRWPRRRPPPARRSRNRTRHSAAGRPACGCGARADPRPRSRRAAVPSRHDRPRPGSRSLLASFPECPWRQGRVSVSEVTRQHAHPRDVVRTSRKVLPDLHCRAHFQELPRSAEPPVKAGQWSPRQRLRSCAAFTEVPGGQRSHTHLASWWLLDDGTAAPCGPHGPS